MTNVSAFREHTIALRYSNRTGQPWPDRFANWPHKTARMSPLQATPWHNHLWQPLSCKDCLARTVPFSSPVCCRLRNLYHANQVPRWFSLSNEPDRPGGPDGIMVDGRSVRAAIGQAALAKENRGGQSENRQMAKSPSCPRLTKNPETGTRFARWFSLNETTFANSRAVVARCSIPCEG